MTGPLPSVVQIASSYLPHVGGVETLAAQVAREYTARGGAMQVVTNRWPPQLPVAETIDGVRVHRTPMPLPAGPSRTTLRWALDSPGSARRVRGVIGGAGAEVVHVQCAGPNTWYALDAARRLGRPLVVSLHGELTMDDSGIYRHAAMRRAWRTAMRRAVAVTGCSRQAVDDAVATYGVDLEPRIEVLPNAVDLDRVRAAPPLTGSAPVVLAAGRLVHNKGFDLLLEAFARLGDLGPLELVVAGDGPERGALTARAQRLGLDGRVRWLGAVGQDELFARMRGAAVFVLPSRREPQGLVLLEAMAAGAPVVACAVDGVPETVHHDVDGLLTAPAPAPLAAAIRQVLTDADAASARALRAAEQVDGRSWADYTTRLSRLYVAARG